MHLSGPNDGPPIYAKIDLPEGAEKYIQGFTELAPQNGYRVFESKTDALHIHFIVPPAGKPFLLTTLEANGQTVASNIRFKVPQTGKAWSVNVSENDIHAWRDDGSEDGLQIEDHLIKKEGGTMDFVARYTWNSVQKTVDKATVALNGNNNLANDLVYTVSNERTSSLSSEGELFSGEITFTDTLTLPDALSFKDGEISLKAQRIQRTVT